MSSGIASFGVSVVTREADDTSLPGLLTQWAALAGDQTAINWLDYRERPGGTQTSWTWQRLDDRVTAVAAALRRRVNVGQPVAVLIDQCPDYVAAFLGALRAGAVAVPLFAPSLPGHAGRLEAVLRDCSPAAILTTSAHRADVAAFIDSTGLAVTEPVAVDDLPPAGAMFGKDAPVPVRPDDLAYLQYTSGSTGAPRGVMVSHGNVIANARHAIRAYQVRPGHSTMVSWLPLFHDMGLMLAVAAPLVAGVRTVLIDPFAFIERPERWLRAMSANPGTISAAPNFAYAVCAARVSDQDKLRLRLDTVTTLIDGAEPVRSAAIEKFRSAFAECGLRPEAHRPSYGLAEATVFVSASVPGQPPVRRVLDRARLAAGQAVPMAEGADGAVELVSCGIPVDQDVAIVDPETRRARGDGEVGEVWVSGANVGHGYWGQPEETARTFHNQLRDEEGAATDPRWWLRTGDLGVRHDGELFVTGRIKDMIIVDGRNHYPHDIEQTVEHAHTAIRRNNTVAFTVSGESGEQAVVLAELARKVSADDIDEAEVRVAVRAAVSEGHGLALRDVRLVPADSLPRTSSGKIARFACRDQYLADDQ